MDQSKFQPSFMPKGPSMVPSPTSYIPETGAKRENATLLGTIGLTVFIIAVVLSVGVFGYKFYLNSQLSQMGSDLEAARQSLQPGSISELSRLNTRISATRTLVSQHISVSALFDLLEAATLQSVRFNSFSYSTSDQGISLGMDGAARSYSAIALQADSFDSLKFLKNSDFSQLALDAKGNVTFQFSTTIDPTLVSFSAAFAAKPTPVAPAVVPVTVVATTTPVVNATTTASSTPKK